MNQSQRDIQHHSIREQSLIRALSRALALVEMVDLDEAVGIAAQLEDDVRLLVGGPIILNCDPAPIAPLLPELAGCIFGQACVHRFPGDAVEDATIRRQDDRDPLAVLADIFLQSLAVFGDRGLEQLGGWVNRQSGLARCGGDRVGHVLLPEV